MNTRMRSMIALTPRPNVRRVHPLDDYLLEDYQRVRPIESYERAMVEEEELDAWDWTTQGIIIGVVILGLTCWGVYLWWVTA